jgi:hypothetical protein
MWYVRGLNNIVGVVDKHLLALKASICSWECCFAARVIADTASTTMEARDFWFLCLDILIYPI